MSAPALAGPAMRVRLNAAEPSAIADDKSSRGTMAWTAAMRAGWLSASDAPKNSDSTTTSSMVIKSANISAANSIAISPDRIWLSFAMRINPTRSAMAPDRIGFGKRWMAWTRVRTSNAVTVRRA